MMPLTDEERILLKTIARQAIEKALLGTPERNVKVTGRLTEKGGAFVTLKKHGELRGCIGYTRAAMPLHETVKAVAVDAAFGDPRFPNLQRAEWKDVDLEISVLTPMLRIAGVEEIRVGEHGLFIEQGHHSGLLLPQVATEYGWDRTTFLEYTCMKAGLPKNAWKSPETAIYVFSAEVF
jgi:AmmeMemoRadiSam system protein A